MTRIHPILRLFPAAALLLVAACGSDPSAPRAPGITPLSGTGVTDSILAHAPPLRVEVRGSDGRPLRNVEIHFAGRAEPGIVFPRLYLGHDSAEALTELVDTTDNRGQAQAWVRLGTRAGTVAVVVTVPSTGQQRTVDYTIRPGAPRRLDLLPGDTSMYVGASVPLTAVLADRFSNPTAVQVAYTTTSPGISLQGGTVTALALGPAVVRAASGAFADSALLFVVPRAQILGFMRGRFVEDTVGYVTMEADGSNARRRVTLGLQPSQTYVPAARYPRWNPAGTRFVHDAADPSGDGIRVYVTEADGTTRRLTSGTPGETGEATPAYSRDGVWVYFTGGRVADGETLYRVRADGSAPPERVLPVRYVYCRAPSPSPDGTRVAFVARSHGSDFATGLYVLDVATGAVHALGVTGDGPRWSPDGQWIAYAWSPDGTEDGSLRLIRPDGTGDHGFAGLFGAWGWTQDGAWLLTTRLDPAPPGMFGLNRAGLLNPATGEFWPMGLYTSRLAHADVR